MRMTASWSGRHGPTEYKVVARYTSRPMASSPRTALLSHLNKITGARSISALTENAPYKGLLTVLSMPYEDQPAFGRYVDPPRSNQVVHQTFCGT